VVPLMEDQTSRKIRTAAQNLYSAPFSVTRRMEGCDTAKGRLHPTAPWHPGDEEGIILRGPVSSQHALAGFFSWLLPGPTTSKRMTS
jgi:hypothetical protein